MTLQALELVTRSSIAGLSADVERQWLSGAQQELGSSAHALKQPSSRHGSAHAHSYGEEKTGNYEKGLLENCHGLTQLACA